MLDASDAAASSSATRKVYVDAATGLRVPFREVILGGDSLESVQLYDSSGPGSDPQAGLPALRRPWIVGRADVEECAGRSVSIRDDGRAAFRRRRAMTMPVVPDSAVRRRPLRAAPGGSAVTQLRYARQSKVTPEMMFVAIREGVTPDAVRDEIAAGRAILPANVNHPESEPMIIGSRFLVKVNANIGNSAVTSSIGEEVDKLTWATRWGGRHGNGPFHRGGHPHDS